MRQFGVALACLFLLVMTFAWQHFKAIEYGYKIETLRVQRDGLIGNESSSAAGRSLAARSRADRHSGAKAGTAIPAGRPGDAHGYGFTGRRNASAGQRDPGLGGFGTIERSAGLRPGVARREAGATKSLTWRLPVSWAAMFV